MSLVQMKISREETLFRKNAQMQKSKSTTSDIMRLVDVVDITSGLTRKQVERTAIILPKTLLDNEKTRRKPLLRSEAKRAPPQKAPAWKRASFNDDRLRDNRKTTRCSSDKRKDWRFSPKTWRHNSELEGRNELPRRFSFQPTIGYFLSYCRFALVSTTFRPCQKHKLSVKLPFCTKNKKLTNKERSNSSQSCVDLCVIWFLFWNGTVQ